MNHPHRIFLSVITAAMALAHGMLLQAPAVADDSPAQPNFIFILIDDQAWNGTPMVMMPGKDFSRTPGYRMPNVEKLASQGIIFAQAYAAHPKCECSRASIQMGRTTTSLNAVDKRSRDWTAPPGDSLANTLKHADASYRTAHFGKWQWPTPPAAFGYDVSDGVTQNSDGDTNDPNDPKQSFGIANRACAFLEKQAAERHPFYLQLSYYAVHAKPQALATTLRKYDGQGEGRKEHAVMAAMAEDLDTSIGVVLGKLKTLGLAQNTFVIYMSDNGMRCEAFKGDKMTVDEGGLRVPLIVTGPGVRGGVYCHEPVTGYDIFPTVLELVAPHFPVPRGVEGGSWRPLLLHAGEGKVQRPIDRMVFHHDVEVEHPQTAIRKGDCKLVYYWDSKESFLYDLSADLGERHNLAGDQPELAARLLAELKTHVRAGLGEAHFAALEAGQGGQTGNPNGKPKGKEGDRKKKGGRSGLPPTN